MCCNGSDRLRNAGQRLGAVQIGKVMVEKRSVMAWRGMAIQSEGEVGNSIAVARCSTEEQCDA